MKLDARTVAALDLAGKRDLIVFDEELPGFGLRLRASGDRVRRSWIAQYRAAGRTRRVLIGSAEKVAPPDARKAARKVLAEVALGGDPQGAKAAARREAARTVRAVVDSLSPSPPARASSELIPDRAALPGRWLLPVAALARRRQCDPRRRCGCRSRHRRQAQHRNRRRGAPLLFRLLRLGDRRGPAGQRRQSG